VDNGAAVREPATLARIRSLAIPPAWTAVWICAAPNGHLQATGRDARGRKQYRYHPRWRAARDDTKYERMLSFGRALPKIRAAVARDLARQGMPRERVLATVVRLLEATLVRVGNEEYARANHSFGLTTLTDRHVEVDGSRIRFHFRGKSGKAHDITMTDRRLARLVHRCRDLPGQHLFQYVDDNGTPQPIESANVNLYLREISGHDFTAKDFRTWAGTLLAAQQLVSSEGAGAEDQPGEPRATGIGSAIAAVAARLGNTVAVCRKSYIHPAVLQAFRDRALYDRWVRACRRRTCREHLNADETALLRFLAADSTTGE
jgi:DNA topoisomerase-1